MESIYDIPFNHIDGRQTSLAEFKGKVILLVNVASACGLTPQYKGLEALFEARATAGLVVVGFPANDFGAQEPGSNEEIAAFCSTTFDVSFPLAQKVTVKGPAQHPLYAYLTQACPVAVETHPGMMSAKLEGYGYRREKPTDILWNFEKFLIGREGEIIGRFNPDVAPDNPVLVAAIDVALQAQLSLRAAVANG